MDAILAKVVAGAREQSRCIDGIDDDEEEVSDNDDNDSWNGVEQGKEGPQ